MSTKILSKNTKFEINTGSAYVRIAGVKSWSQATGSSSVIDATDLDSVAKEKLPGLADEGSISLTCDLVPNDAGQLALTAARSAGTVCLFRTTLSNGTTYTDSVFVVSTDTGGGVDQLNTFTAKLEITGATTVGTATTGS